MTEVEGFHYFRENFALSHAKERKEKICLNCNTDLYGRYCHVCGQQNIEPKETVWGLVKHFFYDITHFDGSFFSTVKYLVAKPGFLSSEYRIGRRASYLNPIRMYIFTSAFFFIIFFSVYDVNDLGIGRETAVTNNASRANLKKAAEFSLKYADNKEDSAAILKSIYELSDSASRSDTVSDIKLDTGSRNKGVTFSMAPDNYKSVHEYDSIQKSLPAEKKDGWFKRLMYRRIIAVKQKYGDDDKTIMTTWLNMLLHQFPKLLFVSLPIFALILRLLYIRRKQYFYVDHGIFSIHLYIFSFILLLVGMGIQGLQNVTGWAIFTWIQAALWIYFFYYNYKAMRNFYKQGRGKTIVKFILLNVLAQISIIILFVIFFILTAFQL